MTHTMRAMVLALVASLTGCGGGSAAAPAAVLPFGTSTTTVLVEVRDADDLAEIEDETGAMVLGPVPGTGFYRVAIPAGTTVEAFEEELDDDVRVVNSELDLGIQGPEGGGSTIPAGGTELAAMIPAQPELLRIGLAEARLRATGAGVRVAVVDTGVLADHPALAGRVDPDGWDFVGEDGDPTDEPDGIDGNVNGLVDEGYGHGTFVSSLVVAVAPDARIVPFRVLDSDAQGTASTLAAAITLAADRGVDVINVSAGMRESMQVVQQAVDYARGLGVVVVSSAGNTGEDDVTFPSALSGALSVTAVSSMDVRAPFASYGSEVDLSAPGVGLLGAFPSPSGTARWSGTSFSAAIASGAFALVREADPTLSGPEVLQRLADRSVDIRARNPVVGGRLGRGRLDLDAATAP